MRIKHFINLIKVKLNNKNFANTPWMVADQFLKMFSGLVIFFYLAKFLGPTKFGQLNYTIAFIFLFFPLAQLGMFTILTRELSNNRQNEKEYLSTAFMLCMLSSLLMFILSNSINFFFNRDDHLVTSLIFIYSFSLFFKPFDVIDYYFQSHNKAKFSSISRFFAVLLSVILKLVLISFKVSILILIYSFLIESILIAIFLSSLKLMKTSSLFDFSFKMSIVKEFFKSIPAMVISALAIAIYSRMDQIMVKKLLSNSELGLYSSAVKLYEGVLTIIFTVTVSLLPALIQMKKNDKVAYEKMLIFCFSLLIWGGFFLAILVLLFRFQIINILYGADYIDASSTLSICFFSLGFAGMGSLTSRYFTVEFLEKKLLYRTLVTLIANFFLNVVLIKFLGKEGAALATLLALIFGNYLLDYFDKDLKTLVHLKNRAFTFKFKDKNIID